MLFSKYLNTRTQNPSNILACARLVWARHATEYWGNRPIYSCLPGDQAFVWQWGWRWPCFDTDLSAFVMYMRLVSIRTTWFTQQKQWGTQRLGHRVDNCKMVYWGINPSHIPQFSNLRMFRKNIWRILKASFLRARFAIQRSGLRAEYIASESSSPFYIGLVCSC